jgi:hypothetical protein
MIDAVDELIAYRRQFGPLSPMLRRVHKLHKRNPHLLDFLVQELREVRASGWTCASVRSLWEHGRWVLTKRKAHGEDFAMANELAPYYARILCILHPDFNGFFVMNQSKADADFGTMLEPSTKDHKPGYIRRLLWAECLGTVPGSAELVKVRCEMKIERGWQPTAKHEPKPVSRRERVRRAG